MVKPGRPGKIALTAGRFSRWLALNETPGRLKGSVSSLLNQGHFDHPKTSYSTCTKFVVKNISATCRFDLEGKSKRAMCKPFF